MFWFLNNKTDYEQKRCLSLGSWNKIPKPGPYQSKGSERQSIASGDSCFDAEWASEISSPEETCVSLQGSSNKWPQRTTMQIISQLCRSLAWPRWAKSKTSTGLHSFQVLEAAHNLWFIHGPLSLPSNPVCQISQTYLLLFSLSLWPSSRKGFCF